jgi:hypothetical protein
MVTTDNCWVMVSESERVLAEVELSEQPSIPRIRGDSLTDVPQPAIIHLPLVSLPGGKDDYLRRMRQAGKVTESFLGLGSHEQIGR